MKQINWSQAALDFADRQRMLAQKAAHSPFRSTAEADRVVVILTRITAMLKANGGLIVQQDDAGQEAYYPSEDALTLIDALDAALRDYHDAMAVPA